MPVSESTQGASTPVKLTRHQQQSQHRRERRKARWEAVRAAYQRGLTQRDIAHEFGLSRKTVRRFLQAAEFPEQGPRRHCTGLEPYREYLEKRWAEGCHNASRLCRGWQQKRLHGTTQSRERILAAVAVSGTQAKSAPSQVTWIATGCFLARQTGPEAETCRAAVGPVHHKRLSRDCHGRTSGVRISRLGRPIQWLPTRRCESPGRGSRNTRATTRIATRAPRRSRAVGGCESDS